MVSEEIKSPFSSYACLKALSKSVSTEKNALILVTEFLKFYFNARHFWAWLSLTNAVMLSESKYFLVGFLGKKPQTLLIPIAI